MAKIKLTKTQLKLEQDALKQFQRFLPTLQLKKQQLQMELRLSSERMRRQLEETATLQTALDRWIALFGDETLTEAAAKLLHFKGVRTSESNIAGITVPLYEGVDFVVEAYDLFVSDWALDSCIDALKRMIELRCAYRVLEEQYRLLDQELATTTQRVNLFEKVKIPECRDNIRRIRIYLSDQETAAVVRSKLAKTKTMEGAA